MNASLITHILVKVGGPVVLFFALVLFSDFYYLTSTLKKDSASHLESSSQEALQIISHSMRREKRVIERFVAAAENNAAPDKASMDLMADELYDGLEPSSQTIRRLLIFYHGKNSRAPPFYCVNYPLFAAAGKRETLSQLRYDRDPNCHHDIKKLIADQDAVSSGEPFWSLLNSIENTRIFLAHPFKNDAAFDGYAVIEIFAEEIYSALRPIGAKKNVQLRVLVASDERLWVLPDQHESRLARHTKQRLGKGAAEPLDYEDEVALNAAHEAMDPVLREPVYLIRQQLPLRGLFIEHYKPADELLQFIYSIKATSIALSVAGLLIVLIIIFLSARNLSRPIEKLASQAMLIAEKEGAFQTPKEPLPKELGHLARALETMLLALKERSEKLIHVITDRERMQSELKVARVIQTGLLTKQFGRLGKRGDFEIYAHSQAARETGGDLYDFFSLDKTRVALLVADVSGKGIPAALLMTMVKVIVKTVAKEKGVTAVECLERVNRILLRENTSTMFVTAFYGILDSEKKCLDYAVAGHNPPIVSHADGSAQYLDFKSGLSLSAMEDASYLSHRLHFSLGDTLLIYTDGLNEAENKSGEAYGEARLQSAFAKNRNNSAQQQVDHLLNELKSFTKGQASSDDITMLCLRYCGADKNKLFRRWAIQTSQREASSLLGEFRDACDEFSLTEENSHDLCLALDELVSNSIRHGRKTTITVIIKKEDGDIKLIYKEPGDPFDMRQSQRPQTDLAWQKRKPGGLGLYLIQQLFSDIDYRYQEGCNILRLTKHNE